MENLSDIELVENIKNDVCIDESLQELINRHSGIYLDIVHSYMKHCPTPELRQDMVDDKEMTIYNSALKYDENRGAKFSTYLGNEAKWKCLNAANKSKKNNKFVEMTDKLYDEEKQKSSHQNEHYILEEEVLESFSRHLEHMPDKRIKKIFKLRYSGNNKLTPWKKISEKMNLSIQGCINIHNSALEKIAKNLKNKYEITG